MIGFMDILVERAIQHVVRVIQTATPDTPAERLASLLPYQYPWAQRVKLATLVLTSGVQVRSGFTLGVDDQGLRPTFSVVFEQEGGGDSPLAFDGGHHDDLDDDIGVTIRSLLSSATIQILMYARTRDEVRVMGYMLKSAMMELSDWLVSNGVDVIQYMGAGDLVPDRRDLPEGLTLYVTSAKWRFAAMDTVVHATRPPALTEAEVVVSETGTTVTAIPDTATQTFNPLVDPVEGGADPQEG